MTTRRGRRDGPGRATSGSSRRRPRGGAAGRCMRVADRTRRADGELDRSSFEAMRAYYRNLEHFAPRPTSSSPAAATTSSATPASNGRDSNDGERWYEAACFVDPTAVRRGLAATPRVDGGRRRDRWPPTDLAVGPPSTGPAGCHVQPRRRRRRRPLLRGAATAVPAVPFDAPAEPRRIPDLPLPAGFEIRPIPSEPAAIRAVIAADTERSTTTLARSTTRRRLPPDPRRPGHGHVAVDRRVRR